MAKAPRKQTQKEDPIRLAAQFLPETIADDGSIEMRLYGGEAVLRQPFFSDPYYMQLSLQPGAIPENGRLMAKGAAVTDGHTDLSNNGALLGRTRKGSVRMDATGLYARVDFTAREDAQPRISDIKSGMLRDASVEPILLSESDRTITPKGAADGYDLHTWNKWDLGVVAMVLEGASASAQTLSHDSGTAPDNMEENMATIEELTAQRDAAQAKVTALETEKLEHQRKEQRIARDAEITRIATTLKLEMLGTELIASDKDISAAREALLAAKVAEQAKTSIDTHNADAHRAQMGMGPTDQARAGIKEMLANFNKPEKMTDNGRRFIGMSCFELADVARGVSTQGRSKHDRVTLAMSTSDFPNLLAAGANKYLLDAFAAFPRTYPQVARFRSLPDFKEVKALSVSTVPMLALLPEGAPVTYGKMYESSQGWRLYTYEKGLEFTRQMMINDDLGAFVDITGMFGASSALTEESLFWAHVAANPTMDYDGVAFFHTASHGNLASANAAVGETAVDIGFRAMGAQTGLDGSTPANMIPSRLVFGYAQRAKAAKLLGTWASVQESAVKLPWFEALQPVYTPQITGNEWYLFGDPAVAPAAYYGYLQGSTGPTVLSDADFDSDGIKVKARLDWGCRLVEHRAAFKNIGA